MSEAPARRAVVVGLFVALGALLLAGGILTIGSLGAVFRRTATVHTAFDDVQGLGEASGVWFSGVRVGTVRDVAFAEGSDVAVELAITRDVLPHIPADARTKVATDGLIGDPIVVLYGGTEGGPTLRPGQVLPAGDAPTTEDMLATLQRNNENLLAVTQDLKAITEALAEGQGTVGRLLADDELYTDLRSGVTSLEEAATGARELTSELSGIANRLDRETRGSIVETAKNLEEVSERATAVSAALEDQLLSEETPVGVLLSDEEAAADLRRTIDQLDRGSRLMAEDLEALQNTWPLRGFFRKRAKERERALEEERERQQEQEQEDEEEAPEPERPPVTSS